MVSEAPSDSAREISVIREALVAADEPDAVVERIAAAELVTLTITEGGYERGGMLDLLARGIAKRSTPLTVISCDNVPRNGEVLRDLLGAPEHVAFPCTVVDRIVPAPEDPLTVIAEPFSWWVIEDFAGPRPDWDAQFVADTRPYEEMKLRLLNASHTALAALGLPKGHTTVAEAIADRELHDFVRRLISPRSSCRRWACPPTRTRSSKPCSSASRTRASSTGSTRSRRAPSTRSRSGCCRRRTSCAPRGARRSSSSRWCAQAPCQLTAAAATTTRGPSASASSGETRPSARTRSTAPDGRALRSSTRRGDAADVALVLLVVDGEAPPRTRSSSRSTAAHGDERVGRAPGRPQAGEDPAYLGGGQLGQDRLADRGAVQRHAPPTRDAIWYGAPRVDELLDVDRLVAVEQREVDGEPDLACSACRIGPAHVPESCCRSIAPASVSTRGPST